MRLSQNDQIIILQAADKHPGPLADWLREWVEAQKYAGANNTFRIGDLPIPDPLPVPAPAPEARMPRVVTHFSQSGRITSRDRRQANLDRRKALLESVDVNSLPLPQRKAVKRLIDTTIDEIEQTDRLPDSETCWLGEHPMEGWEDLDFSLWRVEGTWESGKDLRKWGCEECARLIHRTHPEAKFNAF